MRAVEAAQHQHGGPGALELRAPGGDLSVEDLLQLAGFAELDLHFLAVGEGRLGLPLQIRVGDDDLESAGAGPRLEDADAEDGAGLLVLQLVAVQMDGEVGFEVGHLRWPPENTNRVVSLPRSALVRKTGSRNYVAARHTAISKA